MKTGAVIAAAGMSSRMGDFKPMLKVGAISMLQRICATLAQAGVANIVLVTGFRGDELEKHVAKTSGVVCLRNERYAETQMFDSAKIGFSYLIGKCDRVFFTPVDIPLFTAATVKALMNASGDVVRPVCGGSAGHPIMISGGLLPQLVATDCDGGLRGALERCCADIRSVEVPDEGVLCDADTPEDYSRLIEYHNRHLLRPCVDIALMGENKLFDKTTADLLRSLSYTGTVKAACEELRISYTKAWQTLSALEENLGFALIHRQQGGESGGGSTLTGEGRALLASYDRFTEKVRGFAESCFGECFEGVL